MAKFEIDFDSEVIRQMEKLSDYDTMAKDILTYASDPLENSLRGQMAVDSGAMVGSVKTMIKKNQYGWFSVSRPTGRDAKGVRNMEKLAYAEFGTSKQRATYPLTRAVVGSRGVVLKRLQEGFEKYIK